MTTAKAYERWTDTHVMVQLKTPAFLVAPDEGAEEGVGISMQRDFGRLGELIERFKEEQGREPTESEKADIAEALPILLVPPVPVLFGRLRIDGELVVMRLTQRIEDAEYAFEVTIEPGNIQHVSRLCPKILGA